MAADHDPRQRRRGPRPPKSDAARRPRRQRAPKTPPIGPAPRTDAAASELADRFIEIARSTWAFAAPHLGTAGRAAHHALAWTAGFLLRHRLTLFRASHRAMWWGALAVLFIVGRGLLSGTEVGPIVDDAHLYFAGGLALCLIVLIFAAERRMRLAAFVLGAGHGAFGLVTWMISQA